MFSINIYIKFAGIALGLLGGIALSAVYGFWYGFPFILIGLGLLLSYIFLGTVQSTAQLVQSQDFDAAEKRLNLTASPKLLYKTNRAFYYIMKGTLAMNRKDNDEAEQWLLKADAIDLPSDNETAMVSLQLANLQASKGKWNAAKIYVAKMKKLKVTEPMLKDQIKQFEKAFTNRGQAKHMQGQRGRMRRKGFR